MSSLTSLLRENLTHEQFHQRVRRRLEPQTRQIREAGRFIHASLPELVSATKQRAQLGLEGRQILPGTSGRLAFVGNPPRWRENPTIDEEYLWALNRMYHWPALLRAFTLTGEDRYAKKVIDELHDWIVQCPRPALNTEPKAARAAFYAVTPWRSLEAGIRMFDAWPLVIEHLIDTDLLTADALAELAVSMHEHAECLAEICPVFWPNADHNHYLMEMLGLLSVATLFPEFKNSPAWVDFALRELERCSEFQLTPDGGQIEGCPSYHNGCVHWFSMAVLLAKENGREFSPAYFARWENSLEYSLHSLRPDGRTVPWGDSDPTYSSLRSALWAWIAAGETKYLRAMSHLAGARAATNECLEDIWRIPAPEKLLAFLQSPGDMPALPKINWQKQLKQVALRTGWDREALMVFFACRSPVNNGHAHLDPMGFDFSALGIPILVDPSRFTYAETQARREFKSTQYHNALTIDEKPPFHYLSTWKFTEQKIGTIEHVYESPGLFAADAVQHNFEPAVHRRLVAIIEGRLLLVLDAVTSLRPEQSVQIWYHFDTTELSWIADEHRALARLPNVHATLHATTNLNGSILPGRVSTEMDVAHDSKRLRLEEKSGSVDRAYAVVVCPWKKGQFPPVIDRLRIAVEAEGYSVSYICDGVARKFLWTASRFSEQKPAL